MNKENILKALEELKKSKKRKFPQSYDLIINLKNIDMKKDGNKIDIFLVLPHDKGKKIKICAFVDKELAKESEKVFDHIVMKDDISKLKKSDIKKLSKTYGFFVAQASIMTNVAKSVGKILGPKNLMPNPKAGAVITSGVDLNSLYENLQKTVRLTTRNEPSFKVMVGKEGMKEEELVDNILASYNNILHSLPQEKNNIKNSMLKLTMSAGVQIGS